MTIRRVVCGLLLLSGTVMAADRYMHPSLGAQGLLQEVRPGCLSNRFYENVLADLTSIVDGGGDASELKSYYETLKKTDGFRSQATLFLDALKLFEKKSKWHSAPPAGSPLSSSPFRW